MCKICGFTGLVLLMAVAAMGDTTYVAPGVVSGVWTTAGSPYVVQGDIAVATGNSMTIMPGVEVRFTGNYRFTVEGWLNAAGTENDSIIFTRHYATEESKWRGFRFDAADNNSLLAYCRVEYCKGEGAYPEVRGGCIWINNCSVTVRNCLVRYGYSHNGNYNGCGGGICINQNSNSVIEHNVICNNQADSGGGVLVGSGGRPSINNNAIFNNTAFYAGGGMYVSAGGSADIYNNEITGNSCSGGWGGGGLNLWCATWLYGTYCEVYNNLIAGNNAGQGGGIYSRYETSNIYNNTMVNNTANEGGGIYVITFATDPPNVYNCIIWGNSGGSIGLYTGSGSTILVSYCDVEGGWQGAGNIAVNPQFVTGPEGNYYLSQIAAGQAAQSVCVDAGDPLSLMMPGTTRTDGVWDVGITDMGYHYSVMEIGDSLVVGIVPNQTPTQIPAGGGIFLYDLSVDNLGSAAEIFDLWINARLPNGSLYGPIILREDLNLAAGGNIFRDNLLQNVPGGAPAGEYYYIASVGSYPNTTVSCDSFPFTKLTTGDGRGYSGGWELLGWDEEAGEIAGVVESFEMLKVYPNPFNQQLVVSFELRDASEISLKVYDVMGREIAALGMGYWASGKHTVVWEAEGAVSGVYFIRLVADGRWPAARKIVLLK